MTVPKVVGVAYGGGHANVVIPVLQELQHRGFETTLIALTSAGPQARRMGIAHKGYVDYMHLIDRARAEELGQPQAQAIHNESSGIAFSETLAYIGANLLENHQAFGRDMAELAFQKASRHSFLPVELFKKILAAEEADLVLATNSPRSEKAALIAAQEMGIPSVRVEDLYGVPNLHESVREQLGADLYAQTVGRKTLTPTRICFMCDYARQNFIAKQTAWDVQGVTEENSVVTGQPVFAAIDEVVKTPPAFDLITSDPALPTITWAHQNVTPDGDAVFQMLAAWHRDHGHKYRFIVKVHPNMTPEGIAAVESHFHSSSGAIRFIHSQVPPNDVLWNSHLVMAQESTMLTQAAYMERPVIILDPQYLRQDSAFVVCEAAPIVRTQDQLEEAISGLLDQGSTLRQKFREGLRTLGYKKNGIQNVADVAQDLLAHR